MEGKKERRINKTKNHHKEHEDSQKTHIPSKKVVHFYNHSLPMAKLPGE